MLWGKCAFESDCISLEVGSGGSHVTSAVSVLQADLQKTEAGGEQTEQAAQ